MSDRLLRAWEVAELLDLSPSTVLDWFEAGKLPGFKIGRAVRFRENEILAWLEARRRGPALESVQGRS
jgi:excisionase family DNA binding protein